MVPVTLVKPQGLAQMHSTPIGHYAATFDCGTTHYQGEGGPNSFEQRQGPQASKGSVATRAKPAAALCLVACPLHHEMKDATDSDACPYAHRYQHEDSYGLAFGERFFRGVTRLS